MDGNLVGEWLGKYYLESEIGRGGMAIVYKSTHPHLNRPVAVKVLRINLDEENLDRFKREGEMVAQLRHQNIVQVFDFDFEGEIPYMVMEYIEKGSLKDWLFTGIEAKPWRIVSLPEAIAIFLILAEALEHAHTRGVVHRDIKPANVLFPSENQPILTDFGIAYIMGSPHLTPTEAIVGTPDYMCPEQFSDLPIDARSDIYSMGVLLFQMLTGHMPFEDPTPIGLIYKLVHQPPPFPSMLNPEIPFAVEQIILKAMEKDPNDRFQTITEMARALRNAAGDQIDATLPVINERPLADFEFQPTGAGVRVQIPWSDPFFVGREKELRQIQHTLANDPVHQPICISGMGGIGKTTLAAHIARTYRDHYPQGILWADMTHYTPSEILDRWAEALGGYFDLLPNLHEKSAALRDLLGNKQVLLVIENAPTASEVLHLLPGTPNCKVMVTTRNVDIAPAISAVEIHLQPFSSVDALELALKILGEERLQREREKAIELFNLVENLPLAVKILAGRLASRKQIQISELIHELSNEKSRLSALKIDDLVVRTSFNLSWNVLTPEQQHIFSLLGGFQGRAFSMDAFMTIAEMTPTQASKFLDRFIALSLLSEHGENRYRQHLLLADFAEEHLEDEPATLRKMAKYYLAYGQKHRATYNRLEEEWDHLLAGVRAMHYLQHWATVMEFSEVLIEYWFAQGRFSAAREGFRFICDAAEALGDTRKFADSLCRWGEACVEQNDYEEGEKILNRSLQLYRELYDHIGTGRALYFLGYIAVERSELEKADTLLEESRVIHLQAGDKQGQALCLGRLAYIPYYRKEFERTKGLLIQALKFELQINDPRGLIRTLTLLSETEMRLGNMDRALGLCQRAIQLCNEHQEQFERTTTLEQLSDLNRNTGKLEVARQLAAESLELLKRMGDRKSQAKLYYKLSRVEDRMENFELALELGFKSLQLSISVDDKLGTVFVLWQLGNIYQHIRQTQKACESWKEGWQMSQEISEHPLTDTLKQLLNNCMEITL